VELAAIMSDVPGDGHLSIRMNWKAPLGRSEPPFQGWPGGGSGLLPRLAGSNCSGPRIHGCGWLGRGACGDCEPEPRQQVLAAGESLGQESAIGRSECADAMAIGRRCGARYSTKNSGNLIESGPLLYLPYRERPQSRMFVAARTRVPPAALGEAFRRAVQSVDEDLPVASWPLSNPNWPCATGPRHLRRDVRNLRRHRVSTRLRGLYAVIATP